MTDWRNILLGRLQTRFPLCVRPFAELAGQLGCREDDVLEECRRLRAEGVIRRVGATFDARRLGYYSTLVGVQAAADMIAGLVEELKAWGGVSHCYGRGHALNVWFTLNGMSSNSMERRLAGLKERYGLSRLVNLPAVKQFKLKAVFGDEEKNDNQETHVPIVLDVKNLMLTEEQKQLVRLLQGDMELRSDFFAPVAEALGWPVETVVHQINEWKQMKVVRRFGASVRHQTLGYGANAMVVFGVDERNMDKAGTALAGLGAVSHCYERATAVDWPYNLYGMMHATDEHRLDAIIQDARRAVGLGVPYDVLKTTAEYKKTTATFFLEKDG